MKATTENAFLEVVTTQSVKTTWREAKKETSRSHQEMDPQEIEGTLAVIEERAAEVTTVAIMVEDTAVTSVETIVVAIEATHEANIAVVANHVANIAVVAVNHVAKSHTVSNNQVKSKKTANSSNPIADTTIEEDHSNVEIYL